MNCNSCNVSNIPYIVHESAMARAERTSKRLIIAIIVLIALLFCSNVTWLYAWCQYDYVGEEVVVGNEGEGNANYVKNGGEINNGIESNCSEENTN